MGQGWDTPLPLQNAISVSQNMQPPYRAIIDFLSSSVTHPTESAHFPARFINFLFYARYFDEIRFKREKQYYSIKMTVLIDMMKVRELFAVAFVLKCLSFLQQNLFHMTRKMTVILKSTEGEKSFIVSFQKDRSYHLK